MAVTRREFLVVSGIIAMTAGCTKSVVGAPVKDPDARITEEPEKPDPTDLPSEVKIGIAPYPPYAVTEGGEMTGPLPDVARAVLEKLDIEVTFQVMQWEALAPAVEMGNIDIVAGLGINPERCGTLQFSEPDHVSGTAFAVAAGNPKGLKIYADVAAKTARLGVLDGAPEDQDAQDAGVLLENMIRLPDPTALLAAVRSGEIDCFAFDEISLRDMVKKDGDGVEVADAFMPDGRPPFVGAYAFMRNSELVEPFNEGLRELHESGEWLKMVEPFSFTKDNEPPSDMTTEELCGGR